MYVHKWLCEAASGWVSAALCSSPTDDDSRVVLKPVEGCEGDYINASFVDVSLQ